MSEGNEATGEQSAPVSDRAPDNNEGNAGLYAKFFRGLGDPTRVKIVQLLLERPRNVGELVALLDAPQGRISSHLACLRWCGFVEGVREGRKVTYRVSDPRVKALLSTAEALLRDNARRVASCFIIDTADLEGPAAQEPNHTQIEDKVR